MKKLRTEIIKNSIFLIILTAATDNGALASCSGAGLKYEALPQNIVELSLQEHPYTKKKQYLVQVVLPMEYNGYPIFKLGFYGVLSKDDGYYFQTDLALHKDEKGYSSWLSVPEEFIESSYIEFEYVYKEYKQCARYYRKVYLKEGIVNNHNQQEK